MVDLMTVLCVVVYNFFSFPETIDNKKYETSSTLNPIKNRRKNVHNYTELDNLKTKIAQIL